MLSAWRRIAAILRGIVCCLRLVAAIDSTSRPNTVVMMPESAKSGSAAPHPHEQMLRLVARGFHRELVNYGVREPEILTVAAHLLDNVMLKSPPASRQVEKYNEQFRIPDVQDEWRSERRYRLQGVTLAPLDPARSADVARWLENPKARESFVPRFPDSAAQLASYFAAPEREYFAVEFEGRFVGIVGAENIDTESSKLEMRKLVGDPGLRGRGIGKRATFLFLYHVFVSRRFHKVYLHTLDGNIRNLNLNGNLGFSLEGVFFDDVTINGDRKDLVRMALTEPAWRALFR